MGTTPPAPPLPGLQHHLLDLAGQLLEAAAQAGADVGEIVMPEGFPAGGQTVQDRRPHLAGDERFGDVGVGVGGRAGTYPSAFAVAGAAAGPGGASAASMVDFRVRGCGVLVGVEEAHARPDEDLLEPDGREGSGDPVTAEQVPEAGDQGRVVVHGQAIDYVEEDLRGQLVDREGGEREEGEGRAEPVVGRFEWGPALRAVVRRVRVVRVHCWWRDALGGTRRWGRAVAMVRERGMASRVMAAR